MRLHRPYIKIKTRLIVAERQAAAHLPNWSATAPSKPLGNRLKWLLKLLFGSEECELHHRPALLNRRRYIRHGKIHYDPPANDPNFLVYLRKSDHEIETRIRGQGAQLSDLAIARKRKRAARKKAKGKTKSKWQSAPMLGSRKSRFKRKMNGDVVLRD